MPRKTISINVERKLCAESMGRCMNPDCQAELFRKNGDVIEKAHIVPYCKTADNVYENLVILCPTCHTDFDKNDAFSPDQVKQWKTMRKEELQKLFGNDSSNICDVYICKLRKKLEEASNQKLILTVREKGYKIVAEVEWR